jgi:uroporphyrinogen decarboxylase
MQKEAAPLQNDLLLRALRGEPVERPPVWMMRQAGRYLPDFRALRADYSFWQRCQTPELATEITVMPVDQVGVDAAIIFSDILVVPLAMGFEISLEPSEGPRVHNPVQGLADVQALRNEGVLDELGYVFRALEMTRTALAGRVPLIGFAGAPWTLLCYCVEGHGSKDFAKAKAFCFQHPQAAHALLEAFTRHTIAYLNAQIEAGAQVVQVFDSWAGLLGPQDFATFALPYLEAIVQGVKGAPVILFARGASYALPRLAQTGAAALALNWTDDPAQAREAAGKGITLQGNLDPAILLADPAYIHTRTLQMLEAFGAQRYIANLGHGILPNVPPDNARMFVETVKNWKP